MGKIIFFVPCTSGLKYTTVIVIVWLPAVQYNLKTHAGHLRFFSRFFLSLSHIHFCLKRYLYSRLGLKTDQFSEFARCRSIFTLKYALETTESQSANRTLIISVQL